MSREPKDRLSPGDAFSQDDPEERPTLIEKIVMKPDDEQTQVANRIRTGTPGDALQFIAGYRIIRELGHGGYGDVYLTEDPKTSRTVAIKILKPHFVHEPGYVERFHREAWLAVKLKHPNIVAVHGFGECDGVHYLIMDYIEGKTLKDLLESRQLSFQEGVSIIREATDGLCYAHQMGIIHRDLKPANIMIDDWNQRATIMDFGLARPEQSGHTLTESNVVIGTPMYMSPEQILMTGGKMDRRTDIYSLGVILYELATGQTPFQGETPMAIMRQVLDEDPPSPRGLSATLSESLEAIIGMAMEKDRVLRYQTGEELLEDLDNYLAGRPVKALQRAEERRSIQSPRRGDTTQPMKVSLHVPEGCDVLAGASMESYTGTGWAQSVSHRKSGLELVFIPAGSFTMGSPSYEKGRHPHEGPQRLVAIQRPFYMSKCPVTNGKYEAFVNASEYKGEGDADRNYLSHWSGKVQMPSGPEFPVIFVSWLNANAFCEWAGLSLPSESQWEYACRSGENSAYFFGNEVSQLPEFAFFVRTAGGTTQPVGVKPPNAWGLHDMHGNVWEWCRDTYHDSYDSAPATDTAWIARGDERYRMLRGGCWGNDAAVCRSASRQKNFPKIAVSFNGFRPILKIEEE